MLYNFFFTFVMKYKIWLELFLHCKHVVFASFAAGEHNSTVEPSCATICHKSGHPCKGWFSLGDRHEHKRKHKQVRTPATYARTNGLVLMLMSSLVKAAL